MVNTIVYHSTTGNVRRFLEKCETHAKYMGLVINLMTVEELAKKNYKGKFHLFIPTRGFGQIPDIVSDVVLSLYKDQIVSVSGSGNRNWGKNFCGAVDKIKTVVPVPELIRIELAGTNKDVNYFIESLKILNSVK